MQLKIEVRKRHLYLIIALSVFLLGALLVIAYQSGGPPSYIGHSSEEIEITSNFTTCRIILGPTSVSGTEPWTAVDVPQSCRGRPCKLIMIIFKSGGVVIDLKFGDYYQVEDEADITKERWETSGQMGAVAGNNGDAVESNIVSQKYNYLRDDETTIGETDKTKWSYLDNSGSYGMTIQTCNY